MNILLLTFEACMHKEEICYSMHKILLAHMLIKLTFACSVLKACIFSLEVLPEIPVLLMYTGD